MLLFRNSNFSMFKLKNKIFILFMILFFSLFGYYIVSQFNNTVYPEIDTSIYPSPGLMYFYKLHEIGAYITLFIILLVFIPWFGSTKFLEQRLSHYNNFIIQRIGKKKTYQYFFLKNICCSFAFVFFTEVFMILIIHLFCSPISFAHLDVNVENYIYLPQCLFKNELINLSFFVLLISLAYTLISAFVFSLQVFITNIYIYYASGVLIGIILYLAPIIAQHMFFSIKLLNGIINAFSIRNIIEVGIVYTDPTYNLLAYFLTFSLYSILTLINFKVLQSKND